MIDKHLFRFGFETPNQYRNNAARGFDDEDSVALWIVSSTPAEALQWGETVAQAYVAWLFSSEQTEGYSWRDLGFSNWVEADLTVLEAAKTDNSLPVVRLGEMPDFESLAM
ncbi:hypothetical protein ACETKC_00305 [Brevundimonas intermedia]|nr:hypothetical protein [Brevundimonas intermedia]